MKTLGTLVLLFSLTALAGAADPSPEVARLAYAFSVAAGILPAVEPGIACVYRSDFQSAVSPICNRQSVGSVPRAVVPQRLAECNSAIRQTTSLRYGRWQHGKQKPGILPGGMGLWFGKPLPLRTSGPSGKMPPTTAARLAAAADVNATLSTYRLAAEVRGKGWIVFPARSEQGDWDLFLMRPDGSKRGALTRTPEWNEAAPQFSRDGSRLLYRRLKREEAISGNRYGEQGALVVANSDGTDGRVMGADGELPWASWSPDGREVATLSIKGVAFVDVASGKVSRILPRNGFFQQLTWSPDGKWLSGVANSFGTGWSIARVDAAKGEVSAVNTVDCCTPDWFPDSRQVIFSWRPPGQKANRGSGWTQLWRADAGGKSRALVYGEDGRHVYGGHVSPDGQYVLFTGNVEEDGDPLHAGAPMGLMRLSNGPIIGGESPELSALHPGAKRGPVLTLPAGWEPCWTFSENPAGAATTINTKPR